VAETDSSNTLREMEKLVYLLWDDAEIADPSADAFRDHLLSRLPDVLAANAAYQLKICVTDGAVDAGEKLHLGPHAPQALVSFWLECVQDRVVCEAALDECSKRMAGYLVVESQPLRRASQPEALGSRVPGFTLVGCIEPADGVSHAEFIERWETVHRDVAIATQSTVSYVRNEVVRPLTVDAPTWGGIVEEGFPFDALIDPRVFYDAVDDEERFRKNSKRMVESCMAFLSIDRVDSHPMSEYRFF
jgi:hypothetical protein